MSNAPHPKLRQVPDALLRFGRGSDLLAWLDKHDVPAPTLLALEAERKRRGITRKRSGRAESAGPFQGHARTPKGPQNATWSSQGRRKESS